MTDILDKLRIEAQREPHEPIWREAIADILGLRLRVESLEMLLKMRELPLAEKSNERRQFERLKKKYEGVNSELSQERPE